MQNNAGRGHRQGVFDFAFDGARPCGGAAGSAVNFHAKKVLTTQNHSAILSSIKETFDAEVTFRTASKESRGWWNPGGDDGANGPQRARGKGASPSIRDAEPALRAGSVLALLY